VYTVRPARKGPHRVRAPDQSNQMKSTVRSSRVYNSGVTIGRARRAVHAGPALWGAQNSSEINGNI